MPVVAEDVVAADRRDRRRGAADRPAQRVPAEHGLGEPLVHDVTGVVVVHRELFEDHPALVLDVVDVQARRGDHVTQDVDRHRQVLVQHPGVVAGVLLARDGVGLPADGVERRGDLHRRPPPGALEQQVLQEVGRSQVALGLVPGTHTYPAAEGRRAQARHRLGEDPDPAGEDGAAHNGTARLPGDRLVLGPGGNQREGNPSHVRRSPRPAPRPRHPTDRSRPPWRRRPPSRAPAKASRAGRSRRSRPAPSARC